MFMCVDNAWKWTEYLTSSQVAQFYHRRSSMDSEEESDIHSDDDNELDEIILEESYIVGGSEVCFIYQRVSLDAPSTSVKEDRFYV